LPPPLSFSVGIMKCLRPLYCQHLGMSLILLDLFYCVFCICFVDFLLSIDCYFREVKIPHGAMRYISMYAADHCLSCACYMGLLKCIRMDKWSSWNRRECVGEKGCNELSQQFTTIQSMQNNHHIIFILHIFYFCSAGHRLFKMGLEYIFC